MGTAATAPFDQRQLRDCLGAFVTGVTVVTTRDRDGRWWGMTANSFSSVSLDPPLILWSQRLTAPSYPAFQGADRFAVNILAADQVGISQRFARPADDKFAGVATRPGLGGVPLIEGCAAWLECRKAASYPAGDHAIYMGRVERIERADRKPLAFGSGRYMVVHPYDLGSFSPDLGLAAPARLDSVRLATPVVEELARELDRTVGLAVWGNRGPTIIRWEESSRPVSVNLRTGLVLPVLSSATGRAFAAHLPRELTRPLIEAELGAHPPGGVPDTLEAELTEIRRRGVARVVANIVPDVNERGINAFSVPVFDATGAMVFAITLMGHTDTLPADWDSVPVAALRQTAADLSRRLGYRG